MSNKMASVRNFFRNLWTSKRGTVDLTSKSTNLSSSALLIAAGVATIGVLGGTAAAVNNSNKLDSTMHGKLNATGGAGAAQQAETLTPPLTK
jgi:hypothetical protein